MTRDSPIAHAIKDSDEIQQYTAQPFFQAIFDLESPRMRHLSRGPIAASGNVLDAALSRHGRAQRSEEELLQDPVIVLRNIGARLRDIPELISLLQATQASAKRQYYENVN